MKFVQLKLKILIIAMFMVLSASILHSQTIVEDFETGDFSSLDWQFEGTPGSWEIESVSLNGGNFSASANHIAFNDQVYMTITQTFTEPGQLTFDIQQTDGNIFIIDIGDDFGLYTPGWIVGPDVRTETYDVPAGTYEIRFGSYNIGYVGELFSMKDSVIIDNIRFTSVEESAKNTTRAQIIHNAADLAAEVVDVWLNDTLLIDDFTFRTATPFIDVPAGEEFTIAVKDADSVDPENPIWSQEYTLQEDETYILIANGIVSSAGYDPIEPFNIYVFPLGREEAGTATNTDVLVFHGSTDASIVDIYETSIDVVEIIDNLGYTDFVGYLELFTSNYILEVRDETGESTIAAYQAPLATWGLEGVALTIVASGFLNPNANSQGEPFGLWIALPEGGDLIPLDLITPTALNEGSINGSLEISPNPASNFINVTLKLDEAMDIELEILDVSGRIHRSMELGSLGIVNNYNIDVNGMSEGIYFLRINAATGSMVEKVIITD